MTYRQGGPLLTTAGVSMPAYDAFTMTLSAANTVETYAFFVDGVSGIQVAKWVLTYTDNTRAVLVSGVFTNMAV